MSISRNNNLARTVYVHFEQRLEIIKPSIINVNQVTLKDNKKVITYNLLVI